MIILVNIEEYQSAKGHCISPQPSGPSSYILICQGLQSSDPSDLVMLSETHQFSRCQVEVYGYTSRTSVSEQKSSRSPSDSYVSILIIMLHFMSHIH